MIDVSQIAEHSVVKAKSMGTTAGAPGVQIGIVDQVEAGKFIKLSREDSHDGRHHWFPIEWVESIADRTVYLNKPAEVAMAELMDRSPIET